jgi:UDP-glucose 4-epimerase
MKITIIGSTSFIGGWLTDYLIKAGHEISVVYRNEKKHNKEWDTNIKHCIIGDIREKNTLDSILKIENEIIIYLVSLNQVECDQDYFETMKINVSPILYLTKALSNSKSLKKFIYFSTMQVIGDYGEGEIIDESTKASPKNTYGLTHYFCEQAVESISRTSNLNYTSLRLANSYGQSLYKNQEQSWLVINDFCISAITNKCIRLKSDGTPLRDFVFISDVVKSVNYIIENYVYTPNIVNISSGQTYSILELAHIIKKVCIKLGYNVKIFLPDGEESKENINLTSLKKFKINSWLIENEIKPDVTLELGIEMTIQNLINNF